MKKATEFQAELVNEAAAKREEQFKCHLEKLNKRLSDSQEAFKNVSKKITSDKEAIAKAAASWDDGTWTPFEFEKGEIYKAFYKGFDPASDIYRDDNAATDYSVTGLASLVRR